MAHVARKGEMRNVYRILVRKYRREQVNTWRTHVYIRGWY